MGILFKAYDFRAQYLVPVIIRLHDVGIIEHFYQVWRSPRNMRENVKYSEDPLVVEHFLVSLAVLFAGLTLSLAFFMKEKNTHFCAIRNMKKMTSIHQLN